MSDSIQDLSREPSEEAKLEALNNPNGYVYVIEGSYDKDGEVPSEGIVGAWKVNDKGLIVGTFIPNPNYKSKKKL